MEGGSESCIKSSSQTSTSSRAGIGPASSLLAPPAGKSPDYTEKPYACNQCPATFATLQRLHAHQTQSHNYRRPEARYADDTYCRACMLQLHTRARVIAHLVRHRQCFAAYQHAGETITEDQAREWKKQERMKPCMPTGAAAAHPMHRLKPVRLQGPALPPPPPLDDPFPLDDPPPPPSPLPLQDAQDPAEEVDEQAGQPEHDSHAQLWRGVDASSRVLAPTGPKYVLYLFCGHSRPGDLPSQPVLRASGVVVVPFDIVHGSHADLLDGSVQKKLLDLMASGAFVGMLASPPCETWSVARFRQPGPPPLRLISDPWALPALTARHASQVETANGLMAITLRLIFAAILSRRFVLMEHPQPPKIKHAASIWRTDAMRLLLAAPHPRFLPG